MLVNTATQQPVVDNPTPYLQPPFQKLSVMTSSPKEEPPQQSPQQQQQHQQHQHQQHHSPNQPAQFSYQKQRPSQPKLNSQQQYILQQTQYQKQQQQQKQLKLKEYDIICSFLTQVLNLDDPKAILGTITTRSTTTHLLPNIQFPNDTWLVEDIVIKDSKVKTTLLQEINGMFEQQLIKTNHNHSHHNNSVNIDTQINYYEKLLLAYKVYNVPGKNTDGYIPPMVSLNESDENHQQFDQESFPSPSLDDSDVSSRKSGKKRFSMFHPHGNDNDSATIVSTSTDTTVKSNSNSNGEILNSILSKSKIYNKLKKNRDSSSSSGSIHTSNNNSNTPTTPTFANGPFISTPTNSNYTTTNRNSLSSTITTSTINSTPRSSTISNRRRISSTSDLNEARPYPIQTSTATTSNNSYTQYPTVSLTFQQRIENKKEKYEYYVHMIRLYTITQRLMKQLQQGTNEIDQVKWSKYLDFIKNKLFKFIIIDVLKMILDYGYLNSHGLIKS